MAHGHKVHSLRPVHQPVVTTDALPARLSLHSERDAVVLPKDTALLIRRKLDLDGVPHALVTEAGTEPRSYLVLARELGARSREHELTGTALARFAQWFRAEAGMARGLRHGDRARLPESLALTIDLCPSHRRYDAALFRHLAEIAATRQKEVAATVFVSGRWLEKHPDAMKEIVETMARSPKLSLTFGLHSFEHPWEGSFLNAFTPVAVREDTIRLEQALIEWGVVPSVYYRFPGLVHDAARTEEIRKLDLFPIDADAWLARGEVARDGSLVLVHGNGNEPHGLTLLEPLLDNPEWSWLPLHRFLPAR